ncbi:MAG: non-canonical purine NTP pyrophosphatase [Patescibacteria group bacterium]
MKSLLIATTNPAKFEEANFVLQSSGLRILGLKDFPTVPVEETGATFEENAILKAKAYFDQTKTPCIADDGGLMIDHLHGAPGVHSKRWVKASSFDGKSSEPCNSTCERKGFPRVSPRGRNGHDASDQELADAVIDKMKGVPQEQRTAKLGGFIIFYDGIHLLKSECWLHGYIAENLIGEIVPGFPYRPLLMIPQFNKPYSNLTEEEHDKVNFRRKNLEVLRPKILEILSSTVSDR